MKHKWIFFQIILAGLPFLISSAIRLWTMDECSFFILDFSSLSFSFAILSLILLKNVANAKNPLPTSWELRIESGELKVVKVEILDITGRVVLTSHETTLNISQLSAGTYFVKLKTDKGELTRKVIKE